MKLKQLIIFSIVSLTIVSCSKQEVLPTQETNVIEPTALPTVSTSTSEPNNFAYIFLEPKNKQNLIVSYLKDSVLHSRIPFLGFNFGFGISQTNKDDVLNYINLKYWYNGQLPTVKKVNISQSTYNMDSVSIINSTINDYSCWVTVLIPVSAMSNDLYRQKIIKIGGTNLKTVNVNMNSTLYEYFFDYTGNYIPKGRYRLYTTFV